MRVFINPGHDIKYDSGAVNPVDGLRECDVVLNIGRLVADYLNAAGCRCKLYQSDNLCGASDYEERDRAPSVCGAANDWGADIFVSIHCNAFNTEACGTEVEAYAPYGESDRLAGCIQRQIVDSLGTADRGVRFHPEFAVLNGTRMPAVLVETAFIDNESDAELLRYRQDDFARAIARGVTDWAQGQ